MLGIVVGRLRQRLIDGKKTSDSEIEGLFWAGFIRPIDWGYEHYKPALFAFMIFFTGTVYGQQHRKGPLVSLVLPESSIDVSILGPTANGYLVSNPERRALMLIPYERIQKIQLRGETE